MEGLYVRDLFFNELLDQNYLSILVFDCSFHLVINLYLLRLFEHKMDLQLIQSRVDLDALLQKGINHYHGAQD